VAAAAAGPTLLWGALLGQLPAAAPAFLAASFLAERRPLAAHCASQSALQRRGERAARHATEAESKELMEARAALAAAKEAKAQAEAQAAAEAEAAVLRQEAERLRREADVEGGVLQETRRERGEEERTSSPAQTERDAAQMALRLEAAETKLRRAEAFKLPELEQLRSEVMLLQQQLSDLTGAAESQRAALEPPPQEAPAPAPRLEGGLTEAQWEELAAKVPKMSVQERFDLGMSMGSDGRRRLSEIMDRQEEEEARVEKENEQARVKSMQKAAQDLRGKLNFESLKAMSNEDRLELAKQLGPAFGVSVGLVAVCYWTLSLPIFLYAFHESTGAWPSPGDLGNLEDGSKAAGAVAGVFAVAALLKPLRLLVAFLLTPWTAENVLPLVPWLSPVQEGGSSGDSGSGKQ